MEIVTEGVIMNIESIRQKMIMADWRKARKVWQNRSYPV